MSTIDLPILVGVYEDEEQAKSVVFKLHDAGFHDDQIGVLIHRGGLMIPRIHEDLINIGVSEEEASIYERAFEDGNIIVLVKHRGRLQEAFTSLYRIVLTDISVKKQSIDQLEDSQNSSPNTTTNDLQSQYNDESTLWKLLKDAGLDHLI